jgi:hypothetical protein
MKGILREMQDSEMAQGTWGTVAHHIEGMKLHLPADSLNVGTLGVLTIIGN